MPVTPTPDGDLGAAALAESIDRLAVETGFSGAVRVDLGGMPVICAAYGLARRDLEVPNRIDTIFGIASGGKGLTALTVVSLVEAGVLRLDTSARSLLGRDLPMIADDVTIEHLLSHRSGIGDYFDEEAGGSITDYAMPVPVHALDTSESYLSVLDGHPTKGKAGEQFRYCNGGFVVLAILAERAGGVPFHELVAERVCRPAGMLDTGYLRSDELPGRAAIGYLDSAGPRSNVLHLPVRGSGDGGAWSTLADIHALWAALDAAAIVSSDSWSDMTRPRATTASGRRRYGLGFWLDAEGDGVELEGYDAGVSFRSTHSAFTGTTVTVVSNTSEGTWPVADHIARGLEPPIPGA